MILRRVEDLACEKRLRCAHDVFLAWVSDGRDTALLVILSCIDIVLGSNSAIRLLGVSG